VTGELYIYIYRSVNIDFGSRGLMRSVYFASGDCLASSTVHILPTASRKSPTTSSCQSKAIMR
jgi:hypothetical protein